MTEEEKAKRDVIGAVFYDDEHGYGSKLNTLKHAGEINNDIIMDDTHKFMNKISFRNKNGYSNYNSFIVTFPRDEFMVDIAEIGYVKVHTIIYFYILTFFSKLAYGIEIPNTISNSTALISRDVFNKMGIPKAIAPYDGG